MENVEKPVKKTMSQEERLHLAAKLDKELDDFIEKLPKKKYEDGWPEDRWEEEMNKHPFFMKEPPKPGDDLHPLYEGLQQLKYDPDENEPEELALNYKEDGNFNFKHKNYRSALKDCELALTKKPEYHKALIRAAKCCYEVKNFQKAIEYCDQILDKDKDNKEILELRKKSVSDAKEKERDDRRREVLEKRKAKEEEEIIKEILKRGYKIEGGEQGHISLKKLEPCFPELMHNRVFLDSEYNLVWPVAFVYPEYKIMDYIQQFNETETIAVHLSEVFENCQEWDEEKKYTPQNLNVYYETSKRKIIKVDVDQTLQDVLEMEDYVIKGGTPSFIILVKDSSVEQHFLRGY
ncbi:hypothetical protein NQ318_016525 [Aromia moschata]|uniref:Cns1/TTC4 wheel domain-containing protein n=1 Tax=Aromia moschata TaxID=1265417 RepID=A0AAV8YYC2_9CUCU|nr:hypothetical protein NQ318_016525 [Aromia moschata]